MLIRISIDQVELLGLEEKVSVSLFITKTESMSLRISKEELTLNLEKSVLHSQRIWLNPKL